jgi:hypothetical protein
MLPMIPQNPPKNKPQPLLTETTVGGGFPFTKILQTKTRTKRLLTSQWSSEGESFSAQNGFRVCKGK